MLTLDANGITVLLIVFGLGWCVGCLCGVAEAAGTLQKARKEAQDWHDGYNHQAALVVRLCRDYLAAITPLRDAWRRKEAVYQNDNALIVIPLGLFEGLEERIREKAQDAGTGSAEGEGPRVEVPEVYRRAFGEVGQEGSET